MKLWILFSKGKFENDQKKFYSFFDGKLLVWNAAKLKESEDIWVKFWGEEARAERLAAFERKTPKEKKGFWQMIKKEQ